jgi:MFS family permease
MTNARPKIPRNVIIVAFVALASGFGQDLITPVVPIFLTLLGVSHAGIGAIDGLLQGTTSIFRFVSGILSDRFRQRKLFVFIGYALSSIARPLLALASSFGAVAALRVADGVGKGTKDAPRDALIADSAAADNSGRVFGFHRLIDTAGSVLGPLVAAALLFALAASLATYRLIFGLAVIPGAIALMLIWFGIREPAALEKQQVKSGQPLPWTFWLFTVGTTIAMLTKINDSLFLIRAHDIGISAAWIPVLFAGFTLIYALLSYPIGVLSDRFGKLPFITAGWLLLALVEFGFAYESNLVFALALFAGYGLFYALTEGSGRALIADLVEPANRGQAYAIFHTIVGLAIIAGGYGLGRIWDTWSVRAAFNVSAIGSLLGFAVLATMLVKNRRSSSKT